MKMGREGKRRGPWATECHYGVTVPIYRGWAVLKSGEVVPRYRVPLNRGAGTKYKSFSNESLAREHARDLAKRRGLEKDLAQQSPDAPGLLALAISLSNRAAQIGISPSAAVESYISLTRLVESKLGPGSSVEGVVDEKIKRSELHCGTKNWTVSKVAEAFNAAMETAAMENDVSYVRHTRAEVNRFASVFGTRLIGDLEGSEISQWYRTRLGLPVATVVQYRSAIRNMFRFARDVCEALPAHIPTQADAVLVTRWGRKPASKLPVECYSAGEVGQLLSTAWHHEALHRWAPLIALRAFSAAHLVTLFLSRVSHLGDHILSVDDINRGGHLARSIPFSPASWTWVVPFLRPDADPDAPLLSLFLGDRIPSSYESFSATLNAAMHQALEELKIPWKQNGLRHSLATYFFLLTWNARLVAYVLGNSGRTIFFRHYLKLAKIEDAPVYFRISRPGSGDFSGLEPTSWIPEHLFRTRAEAEVAMCELSNEANKMRRRFPRPFRSVKLEQPSLFEF